MIDFPGNALYRRLMAGEETSDVKTSEILLDEHDAAAVKGLIIRLLRISAALTSDRELIAEANERITANTELRTKTFSAFEAFGFERGDEMWAEVSKALGSREYNHAIDIGKGVERPPLLEKMGEDGDGTNNGQDDVMQAHGVTTSPPPRIKDAIVSYLRSVGEAGATARAVRQHLIDAHNISVHQKTPGMTLYRLLKEGIVRRDGRIWYANAENHENEAPTANTEDASETALAAQ